MYSTLTKTQSFPIVFRVSSKPRYCKQFLTLKNQSLPIWSLPKPSLNPKCVSFSPLPPEFHNALVRPAKASDGEMSNISTKGGCISNEFRVRNTASCCCSSVLRARSFSSSSYSQRKSGEGNSAVRDGKSLPWLSSGRRVKELKGLEKRVVSAYENNTNNGPSNWKKPAKRRLEKVASDSAWKESAMRLEKGAESVKNLQKEVVIKSAPSSWEDLVEPALESNRNRMVDAVKDREYGCNERNDSVDKEEEIEDELDVSEDPRWDKIKNSFSAMSNSRGRNEKPEFNRWNKQENWGRKTWREATESTLPKMVGEGVYGVGPVLAALSAARREFYALYVQEGLDLTSNNKKKKDKKGFDKVLRIAQKLGLSIREISKHDLNMIVDNRPHQGLVLDASPLEMVKIMELDPVSPENENGSLWVALDEVTDPQNLGAIIRSAYFFGAAGIVLCAKNSAPLSGVVSKASAGSLEIMELRYCKNMMQFLVSSAENGWRVLGGSVASKAVPLNEVVPGEPTILVLGSEGSGLRPLVERSCTQLVRISGSIPMDVTMGENDDVKSEETNLQHSNEEFHSFLAVESLNVSVAAGVLLHHLIGSNNNDRELHGS